MSNILNDPKLMTQVIRTYKSIILEYINQSEMIELKNENFTLYQEAIYNRFKEFKFQYPKILDVLISGQDTNMLDVMLSSIDYLNKSNNVDDDLREIRNALGQQLHNTYVKDKIDKIDNIDN